MERESFIFYKSWWDAVGLLPGEMRGEVLTAIIEYGLTGETNSVRGNTTKAILELIKPQIDINNARYESGKKGGRPRNNSGESDIDSNQTETKQEPNGNQGKTKVKPLDNQTETKQEPNVYVNVNDNVNVNVNSSSSRTYAREEPTEEEKKEFFKYFFFQNYKNVRSEVDRFITWNVNKGIRPTMAEAQKWKPEDKCNRVSDKFLETWKQLYTIAAHSGPQGEIAADSMLDENLSGKVMNGGYVLTCKKAVKDWIESNPEAAGQVLQPFLRGCPLTIRARRV